MNRTHSFQMSPQSPSLTPVPAPTPVHLPSSIQGFPKSKALPWMELKKREPHFHPISRGEVSPQS